MKKHILFVLGFLLTINYLSAQNKQAAIWHIGGKKIDFNTNPITITDANYPFNGMGGSTTLADTNGNLLLHYSFHSRTIYDKNSNPLINGTDISLHNAQIKFLFIPKPENENIVYLMNYTEYSVIDLNRNEVIEKKRLGIRL